MKLIKHTEYIYEYKNFISQEKCEEILSLIESVNIPQNVWEDGKNKLRYNSSVNLTVNSHANNNIQLADNIIHEIFSRCHTKYIDDNKLLKFILSRHNIFNFESEYTYRFYDETNYYDWHMDDDYGKHNILSYLLYLNENFEGGKLLFLNDNISIKPLTGSMLCFPCGFNWIHKSTKINTGKKKIIWSCFYKGKNNVPESNGL